MFGEEKVDEETGETVKEEYKAEDIDSKELNHEDKHDFENEETSGKNGRDDAEYYRDRFV